MAAKKKSIKPAKATKSAVSTSKSNGSKSGGSKSNDKGKSSPPQAQALPLFASVFMAAVAFLGGVLTPPSLHYINQSQSSNDANVNASVSVNSVETPPLPVSLPFPLPVHHPCTKSNLGNYLHPQPVPGLHVVCVESMFSDSDGEYTLPADTTDSHEIQQRLGDVDSLRFTFYKGSHSGPLKRRVKVNAGGEGGVQSINWNEVKTKLIMELGLKSEGELQRPWAAFTAWGERIVGENDVMKKDSDEIGSNNHIMSTIAASGMIVITQGGNWMWPGVKEGFERTIELAPSKASSSTTSSSKSRNITIETLSLKPLVLSISGFLSDEECDYIAQQAEPTMQYSQVSLKDADKGRAASDWRTSQSTFLSAAGDPILRDIEYRTASLTRVPVNHQEYVQVLRYGHTEKYDAHHDYFDPSAYKGDPNTMRLIENGKKNRYATVFWYLTDVAEGGHTIFPRAFGLPPPRRHSDCLQGLKVQPQKGKVIIFYSLDASGAMDPLSSHGACPVGEDNVKWAANKWIWNAPMGYVKD